MPSIRLWSPREWQEKSDKENPNSFLIAEALSNVYSVSLIQDRFDALCNLIKKCGSVISKNMQEEKDSPFILSVKELKSLALQFAMAIVNAKDEKDLEEKVLQREHFKAGDPEFMPWNRTQSNDNPTVNPRGNRAVKEDKANNNNNSELQNLTREIIDYLKTLRPHEKATFLKEWRENASVRLLQDHLAAQENLTFLDKLFDLSPNISTSIILNAIKEFAKINNQKHAEVKTVKISAERKDYLKKSLKRMSTNISNSKYSFSKFEFQQTAYLYEKAQREDYRIFASHEKLQFLQTSFNTDINIGFHAPNLRYYINKKNYIFIETSKDENGQPIYEVHQIIGLKKSATVKPNGSPPVYEWKDIETNKIDISSNQELLALLQNNKDKSDPKVNARIKFALQKQIAIQDGSVVLSLNDLNGEGMLVISPKGEMFFGPCELQKFHHTSFLAGGAVLFAGTLRAAAGKIQTLSGDSGHYKPNLRHHVQMLAYLRERGLVHSKIKHTLGGEVLPLGANKEYPLRDFSTFSKSFQTDDTTDKEVSQPKTLKK